MEERSGDIIAFKQLLGEVATSFCKEYPGADPEMANWKGQDIQDFQEDLRQKVKGSVSEKWFYSYVKNIPERLPRIDILNLLSKYAGYKNWNAYRNQSASFPKTIGKPRIRKNVIALLIFLAVMFVVIYAAIPKKNTFYFCFVDADKKEPITEIAIDVILLNEKESRTYLKTDSLGCFSWSTTKDHIRFVAQSPYHKNDTIYRSISSKDNGEVRLRTDDYALMLHYYGNRNVEDWKRRRVELQKLIANDAIIFELLPHQIGVELYSKEAFINKLITPTESLQRLEIVETEYEDEKLVKIKFRIRS